MPIRVLDTRSEEGRQVVIVSSPLAKDGRLPAKTEMTIAVAAADNEFVGIPALQLDVTVVHPAAAGHVSVYGGPDRPDTSTVNFTKGRTVANAAFVGTSVGTYPVQFDPTKPPEDLELIVVKVYTTAAAWIVIDLSGAYATGFEPDVNTAAKAAKRPSPATLARRAIGRLH